MNDRRSLLGRAFDVCLLIFLCALSLHFAVQLIEGIKYWLFAGLVIATVVGGLMAFWRVRREHW